MTSDSPTVCPACEVPPPRASTVTPSALANRYRPIGFFDGARGNHAERRNLVMRGVRCIATPGKEIEMHIAGNFSF